MSLALDYGDFQSPPELAARILQLLDRRRVNPRGILEPTAGLGGLLLPAVQHFPACTVATGIEIHPPYAEALLRQAFALNLGDRVRVQAADIFSIDVSQLIADLPRPLLILGNPPWVTASALGAVRSKNHPVKSNFHGYSGLDALTGKSNFDVSEWILIRLMTALSASDATLAMLCKTKVARKVMQHAASERLLIRAAAIYPIDARRYFRASVDACLFVCDSTASAPSYACDVYAGLDAAQPERRLVFSAHADPGSPPSGGPDQVEDVSGQSPLVWRSGIKHDCAKVMELRAVPGGFQNGLGEHVDIEAEHVYPMLKSSDLAHSRVTTSRLFMLVPQRHIGQDTRGLETSAPKTFRYLVSHRPAFRRRASAVYRNKPEFSVFGVGGYAFAHWKIAVSGMYKSVQFELVGPLQDKPVVFDDTCYFLPCESEEQARKVHALLSTDEARAFYEERIFWTDKRPITKELLQKLDLGGLARRIARG